MNESVTPRQNPPSGDVPTLPPTPLSSPDSATLPPAPTQPHVPAAGSTTEPMTSVETAGASIPGYEILGELGRGGMGVLVALKMILAGSHAGAADLARFRTEAEAIARLQNPNVIQVFEVGECEGKPFFSLEFCGGGSLAQKLDGTPLPPKEAARIVETLARAMAAAHQKNIIHRDLKPANVLLLEDGTPKITDFGLAKKLDDVGQTQSGSIMGTPSYMSPEQGRVGFAGASLAFQSPQGPGECGSAAARAAEVFELLPGQGFPNPQSSGEHESLDCAH